MAVVVVILIHVHGLFHQVIHVRLYTLVSTLQVWKCPGTVFIAIESGIIMWCWSFVTCESGAVVSWFQKCQVLGVLSYALPINHESACTSHSKNPAASRGYAPIATCFNQPDVYITWPGWRQTVIAKISPRLGGKRMKKITLPSLNAAVEIRITLSLIQIDWGRIGTLAQV